MSPTPSPPPGRSDIPPDSESSLPQGQCRYILLQPEIKGQRCACVNFTLSRSTPSATCDCGHLSCYHLKTAEPSHDKQEIEQLKQRIHLLEEQIDRERQGGWGSIVSRVSELEDLVEKSREEMVQEVKGSYRNITRVWQSVETLERRHAGFEHRVDSQQAQINDMARDLTNLRNQQMELYDADMILEERMDGLGKTIASALAHRRQGRNLPSDPGSVADDNAPLRATCHDSERKPIPPPADKVNSALVLPLIAAPLLLSPLPAVSAPSQSWTVHVSLLPSASQPFPFERDTNAYKRCLSRGLHQMVSVDGYDGQSFVSAVSKAFDHLLKGRPWMPLQAKLCDAEQLQGLPMLRPLEPALVDMEYDLTFLREHCAVCDANGAIESLYIAMRADTLSWHFLRNSPRYIDGLEMSWANDPLLDRAAPFQDEQMDKGNCPSAGDIVTPFPNLKRAASELSRPSNLASSPSGGVEGEATHQGAKRACLTGLVEAHRRIEKV